MIHEKLFTEEELLNEMNLYLVSKHVEMLEHNNRLLTERLKIAIGILELQEQYMRKYIHESIIFDWREDILEL